MAKKGLRYAVFATRVVNAETGAVSYTGGKTLSPVAGFNGSVNKSSGKDYGDDKVVDTDNSVTGGTLSVELNNDEDEIYTMLLGHSAASGSGDSAIQFDVDDEAPDVGVGALGKNGSGWTAKWYPRVKFSEPNDDNATKQETTNFGHVTIEGEILIPDDGVWKERETFTTEAAAKTWLNTKAGIQS